MALSANAAMRSDHARRLLSFTQDAALIAFYGLFAAIYVKEALNGRLTAAPFAVEVGILAVIFLTRRRSQATSARVQDWVFATAGGFLPLAFRPTGGSIESMQWGGFAVQMVGLSLTCFAFLYLGRSFGIIAANRGLKVNGPYRFVRHPIYLSHAVTTVGFIAANFGWLNLLLVVTTSLFQVLRMDAEERVLTETAEYAQYKARVRWRLIPGIY